MTYLARWAAVRLLSWWSSAERWSTPAMIAIGRTRHELRGTALPIKPKLAHVIAVTREALWLHFWHEHHACCEGEVIA